MKQCLLLYYLLFLSVFAFGQEQSDSSGIQTLYNRILNMDSTIRNNPARQSNNFSPSDTSSLPIGIVKEIGHTKYIICIDSARFTPQGAFFSVYMALDFPGSPKKIAFAAKNVQFNPKGVVVSNGARLQLVSQQVIELGPKMEVVFKNDGQNFIEWDCDGYKQAGLSVDFVFNDMLVNAQDNSKPVSAAMQVVVQDLNEITYQLNTMDEFYIKGAKDFKFKLNNIVIDRNESLTPQGVNLSPQKLATLNGDAKLWKGFYAQNVTVTLPQKLSKKGQPAQQVYAHDMFIDDGGLSGAFGVNNLFSTSEGSMDDKWGFSVTKLEVDIVNNHLTSGLVNGGVLIKPLDDEELQYSASISEIPDKDYLDYSFVVTPPDSGLSISIDAFKSEVSLAKTSTFSVRSEGLTFVPSAVLNGDWTLNTPKTKIEGVRFQNLAIGTTKPYITSGIFSLISSQDTTTADPAQTPNENKCLNFSVSLKSVGIYTTSTNNLSFAAGMEMNIGAGSTQFAVATTARVITKFGMDTTNAERLEYDRFAVDDIAFSVSTTPFVLNGVLSIKENDPTFGDLFFGSISFRLRKVMKTPMMITAGFGKMNTYRYWFTDAAIPTNIPIPAVGSKYRISSIYGGVQNRVQSTLSDQALLARVYGQIAPPSVGTSIPFTPDSTQGLLFRAGVALDNVDEKVFNAEAMLTVAFNPNGGFASIRFLGQAYMMVKREDRAKPKLKKVQGLLDVYYDNNNKVFDANINASIYAPQTMNGAVDITVHIDTNDWYCWINRPSNRAYLNIVNTFDVNAYFMIGTQIDPIPSPPSYVTNIVGGGAIQNIDPAVVAGGGGFATGVQFGLNFNKEFPKSTDWRGFVDINVGGGFDMMMFNADSVTCSGSTDRIGVNGYYCLGQVYAYLGGGFGLRKYKDGTMQQSWNVGTLQLAALLQGKLPKPSFVYGAVGINANILGIKDFNFTADVEFGNNCTLVGI